MPVTNSEISEELDMKESYLPDENLKAGIYYFSKLYELFKGETEEDRLSLALAAYNAGPSRIYDAQELAAYLGENPSRWSSIQTMLPLLSKRYYSLHQSVWKITGPRMVISAVIARQRCMSITLCEIIRISKTGCKFFTFSLLYLPSIYPSHRSRTKPSSKFFL